MMKKWVELARVEKTFCGHGIREIQNYDQPKKNVSTVQNEIEDCFWFGHTNSPIIKRNVSVTVVGLYMFYSVDNSTALNEVLNF